VLGLHGDAMGERGGSPEWRLACATRGSELKSKRRSRGSHQGVFWAAAITERWCMMARLQLLSSVMAGGSSKGWNRSGLHETGVAQRRQARRAVTMAQNTVEWWRYAWER
jgi:hypothetical protein